MEIEYRNGQYRIRHDGELWTQNAIEMHINRVHFEERVSFVAPDMKVYKEMQKIAESIKSLFMQPLIRSLKRKVI